MTVTALARRCGVSRSTLLHYESLGLLRRPPRTAGNYRAYGEQDVKRRAADRRVPQGRPGPRRDPRALGRPDGDAAAILQRRLVDIDAEIETLRGHQRAILRLLQRSHRLQEARDDYEGQVGGRSCGRPGSPKTTCAAGTRSSRRRRRRNTRSSSSSCTSRRGNRQDPRAQSHLTANWGQALFLISVSLSRGEPPHRWARRRRAVSAGQTASFCPAASGPAQGRAPSRSERPRPSSRTVVQRWCTP